MSTVTLRALDPNASVTDAISSASRETGVDFRYLLETASRESSLNPQAKSVSSSATGLFQFIDQTWFATLKAHGAEHGLGAEASLITQDSSGKMGVADPAQRQEILALRKDPRISSLMAGAFAKDSRNQLQNLVGRPVDNSELYLAHFLGPREAARFICEADYGGDANAAKSFPDAAAANHSVFYDRSGNPRTLAEVKAILTREHTSAPSSVPELPLSVASNDATVAIPRTHLPSFSDNGDEGVGDTPNYIPSSMTSALRLTPQILEILSSLDPFGSSNKKDGDNGFASALTAARE